MATAQTADPGTTVYIHKQFRERAAKARVAVDSLIREKKIPGFSIAVAHGDTLVWAQGFGWADLENKVPVTLQSKFRIGSISKSLTSLALGSLLEEKKLMLSDPVRKYVPGFPEKTYPVTIGQLATHTAGIRDYNYRKGEYLSGKHYKTVTESLSIFKDDTLLFRPGTKYSYSTYGYVLLSAAIEAAAGQPFLAYMQEKIFAPLQLTNTVADQPDSIIPHRAAFYDESDGKIINGYPVNNSNKWAGGGYLSTAPDLVRMGQQLLKGSFLQPATLALLWSPAKLENGDTVPYCLGWRTDRDPQQRRYIHHGGSSIGGRAFLLIYPEDRWIVAVTCNLSTNFDQRFVLQVLECFR